MHRSRVRDEVLPGPRIAREKLRRQQVALQTIARPAGEDDVARDVRAAVRERMNVIQSGEIEFQMRAAVHAAAATITHGRALDGALLIPREESFAAAADAGGSREGDPVEMPTS